MTYSFPYTGLIRMSKGEWGSLPTFALKRGCVLCLCGCVFHWCFPPLLQSRRIPLRVGLN